MPSKNSKRVSQKRKSGWVLFILVLLVAGAVFFYPVVSHSFYPEKPLTIIVPFGPGGAVDLTARALVNASKPCFPQPIMVVNRAGGGGTIGMVEVFQAKPDGYTMLMGTSVLLALQPHLSQELPYKGPEDLKPLMNLVSLRLCFAIRADAPWKTMGEVLAYAKANPNEVKVGVAGKGTSNDLNYGMLEHATKVKFAKVAFGGGAPMLTALLGGHIDGAVASSPEVVPHAAAGKMKVLAVFSDKRLDLFPSSPTIGEVGYDSYISSDYLAALPKETPDAIVQFLDNCFKKSMESDAFQKFAKDRMFVLNYIGPADLKRKLEKEYILFGDLVKQLGLR